MNYKAQIETLVFQAHRLLYHSTLGWRVIKKKKKQMNNKAELETQGKVKVFREQAEPFLNPEARARARQVWLLGLVVRVWGSRRPR